MRSKPGGCQEEEHSGQRAQQREFKGMLACAGIRVVRAEWEEERYTEETRLAGQVGQSLMGLKDCSEDLGFILSELRATEPLNFGHVGVGGLFRLLPFPLTQSTSATSLGLYLYTPPPPHKWLQSEDTSCLCRPLTSWCHLLWRDSLAQAQLEDLGKIREVTDKGRDIAWALWFLTPLLISQLLCTLVLWLQSVTEVCRCCPCAKVSWKLQVKYSALQENSKLHLRSLLPVTMMEMMKTTMTRVNITCACSVWQSLLSFL